MIFLLQGFSLAIGLIVAIGAQNAFVLERSLRQDKIFLVVLLCIASDITFFALGAYGLAFLETLLPGMQRSVAFVSGIFLLGYSMRSLYHVSKDRSITLPVKSSGNVVNKSSNNFTHSTNSVRHAANSESKSGFTSTVLLTLAVTLLNPHFYLDTVFLFGSKASQFLGAQQFTFLLGGSLGSIVWFLSLMFLGKHASKYFVKSITWKILDTGIAVIMAYWAYVLLLPLMSEQFSFFGR